MVRDSNDLLTRIESARLWAYFHKDWLLQIRGALRPQLPGEYFLFVESETIVVSPTEGIVGSALLPDASVSRPRAPDSASRASGGGASGSSSAPGASSEATAALIDVEEPCEILRKYSLVIRRSPENEVVATLEILSPSNKGVGSRLDLERHDRKRARLLEAGVNVFEVDALREGERVLPPSLRELDPRDTLANCDRVAWTAFHHDGQRRLRAWGWSAPEPPPVVPWTIDERVEALVDLRATCEQALSFNRWEALVGAP